MIDVINQTYATTYLKKLEQKPGDVRRAAKPACAATERFTRAAQVGETESLGHTIFVIKMCYRQNGMLMSFDDNIKIVNLTFHW